MFGLDGGVTACPLRSLDADMEKPPSFLPAFANRALGLPSAASGLAALRKTDPRKVRLAILLRTHTAVGNRWVAEKLAMGHPGTVSRAVSEGRAREEVLKPIKELERMLIGVL